MAKVTIKTIDGMEISGELVKNQIEDDGSITRTVKVENLENLKDQEITLKESEVFLVANTGN